MGRVPSTVDGQKGTTVKVITIRFDLDTDSQQEAESVAERLASAVSSREIPGHWFGGRRASNGRVRSVKSPKGE